MTLVSSHPDNDTCRYEGSPPQGPSRGTAGQYGFLPAVPVKKSLKEKKSTALIRRGGAPPGAAA
jgi:hypothetical protein